MDHSMRTRALVALLRYTDARKQWRTTVTDVLERGAVEVLREAAPATLLEDPVDGLLDRAVGELKSWEPLARVLTIYDDDYPPQLREVHDLPPVLFARGSLAEDRGACIVGSRQASDEALTFAYAVAHALASARVPVVSGLAAGIDAAAHHGALDAGGRTVAVIGTGIDQTYPAANRELQQRIEEHGLVLSQFWPGSPPTKTSFPMRNATMSAYGACTLVVAAGEHSGARIQARQAIAHGRPLLLTRDVVTSTRWGSTLAQSAYDVHVVAGVDQAAGAVEEILQRPRRVDELLLELTTERAAQTPDFSLGLAAPRSSERASLSLDVLL